MASCIASLWLIVFVTTFPALPVDISLAILFPPSSVSYANNATFAVCKYKGPGIFVGLIEALIFESETFEQVFLDALKCTYIKAGRPSLFSQPLAAATFY
jgi:hypothetical protein